MYSNNECMIFVGIAFGTLYASKLFHVLMKIKGLYWFCKFLRLSPVIAKEWGDKEINILIHTCHLLWIFLFAMACVVDSFHEDEEHFTTSIPSMFLCSFYIHELNIRKLTPEILLHHLLYAILTVLSIGFGYSILMAIYTLGELGMIFQFIPYLMYKAKVPLRRVFSISHHCVFLFFVVRVLGSIAISLIVIFTFFPTWDILMGLELQYQAILFLAVTAFVYPNIYLWMEVSREWSMLALKMQEVGETPILGDSLAVKFPPAISTAYTLHDETTGASTFNTRSSSTTPSSSTQSSLDIDRRAGSLGGSELTTSTITASESNVVLSKYSAFNPGDLEAIPSDSVLSSSAGQDKSNSSAVSSGLTTEVQRHSGRTNARQSELPQRVPQRQDSTTPITETSKHPKTEEHGGPTIEIRDMEDVSALTPTLNKQLLELDFRESKLNDCSETNSNYTV